MDIDPKKPIQIWEWTSKDKKNKFEINNIYQDDQIEEAVQKILNHLNYTNIYIWSDDEIIEFSTSTELNNINPFKYDYSKKITKLTYTQKKGLFLYSKINLLNYDTVKHDKKITDIFFKYDRSVVNINQKTLDDLYNQSNKNNIQTIIISFYEFESYIKLDKVLKYLYTNVYNDKKYDYDILFWVYDNYNKHITVSNTTNYSTILTELNEEQYENEQLILIKFLNNTTKYYYKITINSSGYINFKIYLDNKIYTIEKILHLKKEIIKSFTPIQDFTDVLVKAQIKLTANNFTKEEFNKNIKKIYNFINTHNNTNFYTYNRTSSNTQYYDISTYINELKNTSEQNDIVEILFYQQDESDKLSKKELKELIESVISNDKFDGTKHKKFYFPKKTFFTINKNDNYNMSITINNIKSILELFYFNFWISRITYTTKTTQPVNIKQASSSSSSSQSVRYDKSDNSSVLSSGSDLSGGAPSKKTTIRQLAKLRRLDGELFSQQYNNIKYASICQSNRQPLGLKTSEFIGKYENNVDNYLTIGENTYFCPRYWCPKSEKPLMKETDKCDSSDDTPVNIYNGKTGTFANVKERYVKYFDKKYKLPCCYAKLDDSDQHTDTENNNASNIHIYTMYNKEITEKRYGILPSVILDIINKANNNECSKKVNQKLTKNLCPFRTGMSENENDLMDILTFLLKYKSRKQLVKAIYNKLDFISFIALENGYIAREFMKRSVYKKELKKSDYFVKNTKVNINRTYLKYVEYAFNEYIDYLQNQKVLNPHYLYSVISLTLNYNLYIWKYKSENDLRFLTPLYCGYNDLKLLSESDIGIHIFYNLSIDKFEPIILKSTNNSKYTFITKNISIETNSDIDYNILDILHDYIVQNKFKYKIKTILLNNNLSVNHFVLANNAVIKIKNNFIEPIQLPRLLKLINYANIKLYDEFIHSDFEKNFNIIDNNNFVIIQNNLHVQRFHNSIIFYNKNITLLSEKKNNEKLQTIIDNIYYNNITDSIFQHEINNHKNITDWYNSYNFNNTFITDNIQYNKGNYSFSSKAINKYKSFFTTPFKTDFINYTDKSNTFGTVDMSNNKFVTGQSVLIPNNKWKKSYKLEYINSNNYNNESVFELLAIITKNKTAEIKELSLITTKILFGSEEGFKFLYYILNYKDIICNELNIINNTQVNVAYIKFDKNKEKYINAIIPKLQTSEIHLYAASELLDIVIIVIYYRSFKMKDTNDKSVEIKRNDIADISRGCNLFANVKIRNGNYKNFPLLMIYSDYKRLYFIKYYPKIIDIPQNIIDIINHKLSDYKPIP